MNNIVFGLLEVKNFKVHDEINHDFSSNKFTLITGNNGQGKTSIFDALFWALYDEDTKGRSGDSIVRKRSKKDTSVIINWTCGDDEYIVKAYRKHSKYKNDRFLYKNGSDISGSNKKETLEIISSILMPKDIFRNCLLFSQYVKDSFTEIKHSDQKNILDSMLSLDVYDDYYTRIHEASKTSEEQYELCKLEIPKYEGIISSTKDDMIREEESTNKRLNELEQKQQNRRDKISENNNKIKEINEKIDDADCISEEINKYIERISALEYEYENIEKLKDAEIRVIKESLGSKIAEFRESINSSFREQLDSLSEELTSINDLSSRVSIEGSDKKQKANERYDTKKRSIEERKSSDREELRTKGLKIGVDLTSCINQINDLKNNIEKCSQEISKIDSRADDEIIICPCCGQEIVSEDAINHLEEHKKKLISDKEYYYKSLDELNIKKTILEKDLDDNYNKEQSVNNKYDEDLSTLHEKYSMFLDKVNIEINHKLDELNEKKKSIEGNISKLKNEIDGEIDKKKEETQKNYIINVKSISKEFEEKMIDIKTNLVELERCKADVEQRKKENDLLIKQINDLENENSTIKEVGISTNEEIQILKSNHKTNSEQYKNRIEEYIEKIDEIKKSMMDIKEQHEAFSFWKKAFSDTGIKGIILDESIPVLNEWANELSSLTNGLRIRFDSQQQLKSGEFRNRFSLGGLNTTNLSEFNEFSAGEQRISNIIVLLSLRHLLEHMQGVRFNIILMDEILDSLDPTNANIVIDMLRRMSSEYCVVLISHTFKDYIESDIHIQL